MATDVNTTKSALPGLPQRSVRVCNDCPFLSKNHGKPHPAKWFSTSNIRRLWNGLRKGNAPGMVCHMTDPENTSYGGTIEMKEGQRASECAGALMMVYRCVNAFNDGHESPVHPPMTKAGLRYWVERYLFQGIYGRLPEISTDHPPEAFSVPAKAPNKGIPKVDHAAQLMSLLAPQGALVPANEDSQGAALTVAPPVKKTSR